MGPKPVEKGIPPKLVGKKFRESVQCPNCTSTLSHVIDSRPGDGRITRRRVCSNLHRFSTVETAKRK